ncbi:hypothetical protein MMPV_001834 [Pyropia vietnamensis]
MSSSSDHPPSTGTDDSDGDSFMGDVRPSRSSSGSPPPAAPRPGLAAAAASADAAEMARLASELASLRDGEAAAAAALSASAARERRAAAAVAAQQEAHDAALRLRMRLQPVLAASGRLPTGEPGAPVWAAVRAAPPASVGGVDVAADSAAAAAALSGLATAIVALQGRMATASGSFVPPPLPSPPPSVANNGVTAASATAATVDPTLAIGALMAALSPWRDSVADEWAAAVRESMGGGGSSGGSGLSALHQPPSVQIARMLADAPRLIERTRVRRSRTVVIGLDSGRRGKKARAAAPPDEKGVGEENRKWGDGDNDHSSVLPVPPPGDSAAATDAAEAAAATEVYDDGDFYQQLLREVVDGPAGGRGTGAGGGAAGGLGVGAGAGALAVRRARAASNSRAPGYVADDGRRRSKGRAIRYDVHEKLVGFLAPRGGTCRRVWRRLSAGYLALVGGGDNSGLDE